ncbi:MAG: hypothetical protein LC721_11015, partial [Actinobacteria bacterium]|nr:hypothetical protein [Actinomycetota bacterium]
RHNHPGRDSFPGSVGHQQRTGAAAAGDVMSTWTVAFYDYAEQVLKAQRQFLYSVLSAGASMLDVSRDVLSSDANEGRSAHQMDARGNQHHEGSTSSQKNERDNDDDTTEYNKRSLDNDMSGDTSDTTRTERANTTDESTKTRTRGAASAEQKLR